MPVQLALVGKDRAVLRWLGQVCSAEYDLEIVARATTGRQALQKIRRCRPDVVVLDMRLENPDAVTVLRQVRDTLGIRTIILDDSDSDAVRAAIRIGVQCVMLTDKVPTLLAKAIRDVHAGGKWFERDYAIAALGQLLAPGGEEPPSQRPFEVAERGKPQ